MEYSDSFFHDPFSADKVLPTSTTHVLEPECKVDPSLASATAISELMPAGISSSFQPFDWPESYNELERETAMERAAEVATESQRYSPTFFLQDGGGVSLAETLTSQATFRFDLDTTSTSTESGSKNVAVIKTDADSTEPNLSLLELASTPSTPMADLDSPTLQALEAAASIRKSVTDFKSPNDFKAYKIRREKNNEASRRSRTKFRQRAREMEEEVYGLRQENSDLKKQLNALSVAFEALRGKQPMDGSGSLPRGDTPV